MPRQARAKSESGVYHVMLRGINGQQIFEDEEDNQKYIEVLQDCKAVSGFEVFAYCLMGNHMHLIIKEGKEKLEQIFKRIGDRYVYWYNWKYRRRGHLFQDRYKSEPIEDDTYLLTVLRYVHQNPVKAGLSKTCGNYIYSSYNDYIRPQNNPLTDINFVKEMISEEQFIELNEELNNDKCLEMEENNFRLTDDEAKRVIFKVSKCRNIAEFQKLEISERNRFIKELKIEGLSIRQISRLTGISFGLVRKE